MSARHRRQLAKRSKFAADQAEQLLPSLLSLYQLLRNSQTIDEMLQTILDLALSCVPGAQRGSIMVREGDYLFFRAARGYELGMLKSVRFPASGINSLIPSGQRASQIDTYEDWDVVHLDADANTILERYGKLGDIRRSLMTSIIVSEQFYGTLVLDNLHSHSPFPPESVSLAVLFAEQAGAVIEQAQLLAHVRRANSLLAESEKLASLGRLIAGVAHEINNPLTAVLGHAELLADEALSADARKSVVQIQLGAERVHAIVRNLQVFARQQNIGQSEIGLNQLIEQMLGLKQAEFALDGIEVSRDLAPGLPATWGDAGLLSQVLLNLLVNAQYALRGRDEPRRLAVRTWVERCMLDSRSSAASAGDLEQRISLSVADNGPGIPADLLPRIFEPFFTTKPVGQGTGLGLSVCYGIVAQHGGRIWAESRPDHGATFVIELPVQSAGAEAQAAPVVAPALPPRNRRILLVDDDDLVIQMVRAAFEKDNQLVIARDGRQGLQLVRQGHFDSILCDLKMPRVDGINFYNDLAGSAPELLSRLLFISGDTSNSDARDFVIQSGRPLLSKPFTLSELYRALARLDQASV